MSVCVCSDWETKKTPLLPAVSVEYKVARKEYPTEMIKLQNSSNYLTNDVKKRTKTARAYKLNDSDPTEVEFMSCQQ